jgi:hypothetical protein
MLVRVISVVPYLALRQAGVAVDQWTQLTLTRRAQAIALLRQAHSFYHTLDVPEAIEIQTILSELDKNANQPPDQPASDP